MIFQGFIEIISVEKVLNAAMATLPHEGFIKLTLPPRADLSSEQRVALIRKGNVLFSQGMFDQAKRIFMTCGYSDGLIRLGDHYEKNHDPLEALRMYSMAPAPDKREVLVGRMAAIVRNWIKNEDADG